MVVVARLLVVHPADQPDVDVRVAVELRVVALAGVVGDEVAPDVGRPSDQGREVGELGPLEVAPGRDVLARSSHVLLALSRASGFC